jgi:hypothetical protein
MTDRRVRKATSTERTVSSTNSRTVTRSAASGRYVSKGEARAAARTKVSVDKKLGRTTAPWVKSLADE